MTVTRDRNKARQPVATTDSRGTVGCVSILYIVSALVVAVASGTARRDRRGPMLGLSGVLLALTGNQVWRVAGVALILVCVAMTIGRYRKLGLMFAVLPALLLAVPGASDKEVRSGVDFSIVDRCAVIVPNQPYTPSQCYQEGWRVIAKQIGIPMALKMVTDRAKGDPTGPQMLHCHETLHGLGYLTFESGYSVEQAIKWGEPHIHDCSNGYIHGSLEKNLYAKSLTELHTKMDGYCRDWGITEGTAMWISCVHILGHSIAKNSVRDPEYRWLENLNPCVRVLVDQSMCWGGAFMEHFIDAEHVKTVMKGWPLERAYEPCGDLPVEWGELARIYCGMEASTQIYKTVKEDINAAFEVCDRDANESPEVLRGCYLGIGKSIIAHEEMSPVKIRNRCSESGAGDRCYEYAAWMYANNTTDIPAAQTICEGSSQEGVEKCRKATEEGNSAIESTHN